MAFKKREYNYWKKHLRPALWQYGANSPYFFKRFWEEAFIKEENYEGMKATNDLFNEWYDQYKMSEKETEQFIRERIKNHPIYGQSPTT